MKKLWLICVLLAPFSAKAADALPACKTVLNKAFPVDNCEYITWKLANSSVQYFCVCGDNPEELVSQSITSSNGQIGDVTIHSYSATVQNVTVDTKTQTCTLLVLGGKAYMWCH